MFVMSVTVNLFEFDEWIFYASRATDATKLSVFAYKIYVHLSKNYLFVHLHA